MGLFDWGKPKKTSNWHQDRASMNPDWFFCTFRLDRDPYNRTYTAVSKDSKGHDKGTITVYTRDAKQVGVYSGWKDLERSFKGEGV